MSSNEGDFCDDVALPHRYTPFDVRQYMRVGCLISSPRYS
ncbi:MAG: hypothetical protein J07HQW1_00046, partial [Haloquadratum walsbyi J07HQW1]